MGSPQSPSGGVTRIYTPAARAAALPESAGKEWLRYDATTTEKTWPAICPYSVAFGAGRRIGYNDSGTELMENFGMKRVLITGAAGEIGTRLRVLLKPIYPQLVSE